MNLLHHFQFPDTCLQDMAITKLSLKNQVNATLSDIKLLDGSDIQSMRIKAVLKQETTNIPSFVNSDVSYVEIYIIEVVCAATSFQKNYKAIARLLHKMIPHHCLLLIKDDEQEQCIISLTTKLINKNSADLRVIQTEYFSNNISLLHQDFINALAFSTANKQNLKATYDYYIQVILNYNLIDLTTGFKFRNYHVTQQLLSLMEQMESYEGEIARAVKDLKSTTQMSEKVRLNSDIHTLKNKIEALKNEINSHGKD